MTLVVRGFPLAIAACLLAAAMATAQDPVQIKVSGRVESAVEGDTFVIQGRVGLPDGCRVAIVLSFAGEQIHETWSRPVLRGDQFELRIGPIERNVLAGYYEIRVLYQRSFQPREMLSKVAHLAPEAQTASTTYFGSPEREQSEEDEYRAYIRGTLPRIEHLYRDLREHRQLYLSMEDGSFSTGEFLSWSRTWHVSLDEAKKVNARFGSEGVLAPRFPESVRDLAVMTGFLDLIYREHAEEIFRRHGLPLESLGIRGEVPTFSLMATEYVAEASRRAQVIVRRETRERRMDSYHLYRDLIAIEALFKELEEAAGRASAGTSAEIWGRWALPWRARRERLARELPNYKGSELSKTIPNLAEDLSAAVQKLGALESFLLERLALGEGGSAAFAEAGKTRALEVQQILTRLFDRVLAERQALAQKLREILGRGQDITKKISGALDAVSGGGSDRAWSDAQAGWTTDLERFRNDVGPLAGDETIRFHFPRAARLLHTLGETLTAASTEGDRAAASGPDEKYRERTAYFLDVARRMVEELDQELSAEIEK